MNPSKHAELSDELWLSIASWLPTKDQFNLSISAKRYNNIVLECWSKRCDESKSLRKRMRAPVPAVENIGVRIALAKGVIQKSKDFPLGQSPDKRQKIGPDRAIAAAETNDERDLIALEGMMLRLPFAQEFLARLMAGNSAPDRKISQIYEWMDQERESIRTVEEFNLSFLNRASLQTYDIPNDLLEGSKVIDQLPSDSLAHFSRLQKLNLQGLALNSLPHSLVQCPVQELNLAENNFNEIPEVVYRMQELRVLDLSGNRYLVGSLDRLSQCPNLRELKIQQTGFATEEIRSLANLRKDLQIVSDFLPAFARADSQTATQPDSQMDLD